MDGVGALLVLCEQACNVIAVDFESQMHGRMPLAIRYVDLGTMLFEIQSIFRFSMQM